jgi:hypothetical protein
MINVEEKNSEEREMNEINFCESCGHFHLVWVACPDSNRACDSYLCCISSGSDDNCSGCGAEIALDCSCDDDGPTVVNIYGANYGTINM